MKRVLMLSLFLFGCGESGVTTEDAAKVVKETISEIREKDVVTIRVRLEKSELPSETELAQRKQIEETIENEGIGNVSVAEAGVGWIGVSVEVDSTADAVPRIRDVLETMGLLERSTVSVGER
jgi:hypothetical protein